MNLPFPVPLQHFQSCRCSVGAGHWQRGQDSETTSQWYHSLPLFCGFEAVAGQHLVAGGRCCHRAQEGTRPLCRKPCHLWRAHLCSRPNFPAHSLRASSPPPSVGDHWTRRVPSVQYRALREPWLAWRCQCNFHLGQGELSRGKGSEGARTEHKGSVNSLQDRLILRA